jgi:hypothetical protein
MSARQPVYIGTDGGATTSKIAGVWEDETTVSTELLQRSTNSHLGPEALVSGWVEAITEYLDQNALTWEQVLTVADQAQYLAKRSGANAWASVSFSESASAAQLRLKPEESLAKWIADDAVTVETSGSSPAQV